MSILTWIEEKKRQKVLNAPHYSNPTGDSNKGLWTRCDKCGVILYIKHLKENQRVCFGCGYHLQMTSQERISNLLDKSSWRALDETVSPCDPLEFYDQKKYTDRLQAAQEITGLQDAVQTGTGMIDGIPVALAVMDFSFMGGSMGSVVGEKITRLIEYATQEGLTLLIVSASGGARMQEGVFSLMQMAKISSALQVYQSCANLLYISILTSPTTGGVTASFAMLGDIIFAEPKALIAFAGRRVIEQTLRESLPDDFQSSEYMLHHGLIDLIVPRRFLREAVSETMRLYQTAPFKKVGRIPFGVQNPISFITEETIRRRWTMLPEKVKRILSFQDQSRNAAFYKPSLCLARESYGVGNEAFAGNEVLRWGSAIVWAGMGNEASVGNGAPVGNGASLGNGAPPQRRWGSAPTNSNQTVAKPQTKAKQTKPDQTKRFHFKRAKSKKEKERQFPQMARLTQNAIQAFSHRLCSKVTLQRLRYAAPFLLYKTSRLQKGDLIPWKKGMQSRGKETLFKADRFLYKNYSQMRNEAIIDAQAFQTKISPKTEFFNTRGEDVPLKKYKAGEKRFLEEHVATKMRQSPEYRDLLHDFEALFHLFSKHQYISQGFLTRRDHQIESDRAVEERRLPADLKHYKTTSTDLITKAIEMAATELVEWRAFYLHQSVEKRTGFLEDFVTESFPDTEMKRFEIDRFVSTRDVDQGNQLFYKAISFQRNL